MKHFPKKIDDILRHNIKTLNCGYCVILLDYEGLFMRMFFEI